jgi:hypothetical protein
MSQLTPCPECQRHVRKTEARCPFCDTALSLAHLPAPALPRKRLGRAATFAFGATVAGATAIAGCEDQVAVAPPYGGPGVFPGGSSFAGSAVYGAPPSGSANGGSSNGGSSNGGTDDELGGMSGAVYGAPAAGAGGDDLGGTGGTAADGGAGGVNQGEGGATIYGGPPAGAGGV